MDHELMTMWLSVDPMADKYPSISPYAYCAWNPIKLVDPDGREIDLSQLNSSARERLVKCLSTLTGLSLFVNDEGRLDYAKDNEGMAIGTTGSKSARADLIEAIDKKNEDGSNYLIEVGNGGKCEGGQNPDKKGGIIRMYCGKMKEENDCNTNGLGMVFLHELRHAVTGESDPEEDMVNLYVGSNVNTNHMVTGSVVDRVNVYRQELNMPIRLQYYARPDNGKIPFCNAMYKKGPDIRKHTIWLNINSSVR